MIGDGERNLRRLKKELSKMEQTFKEVSSILDSSHLEDRIISDESTPEERAMLLERSKELTQEKEQLEKEIHALEQGIVEEVSRIEIMLSESEFL